MNHVDCWLDALPPEAPERELLAAAERDVPPPGSMDRNWSTLCAAAALTSGAAISGSAAASISPTVSVSGSAALTSGAAISGSAAASASSATGLGCAGSFAPLLATGKAVALGSTAAASATAAAGVVGLPVAAKAMAVGFAIGLGALGTGELIHSVHPSTSSPIAATARTLTSRSEVSHHSTRPKPLEPAKGQVNQLERTNSLTNPLQPVNSKERKPHPDDVPTSVAGSLREGSKIAERADSKRAERKDEPPRSLARQQVRVPTHPAEVPLSQQAAELAQIKGLLDSGAPHEALVRLRACLDAHALSAIAEDRDALYIEALKRARQDAEARRAAGSFYVRYPNSPQRDRIGELVAAE